MSDSSSLRIGLIPFINTMPLDYYLPQTLPQAQFVRDVPSQLAPLLARGEIDAALLSSIELLRHPEYGYIPGMGICSENHVASVCLFAKGEPQDVKTAALDNRSLTSSILLRVLYAEYWRRQLQWISYAPPVENGLQIADAALAIGDAALEYGGEERRIDLGEVWKRFSGFPFVFAVWIVRPGLPPESIRAPFAEAKRLGMENRRRLAAVCAEKGVKDAAFYYNYLTQNVGYDLGPKEQQGMEFFFQKAKPFL
ncbi:MAG: menaquinone biosynthesis protein [Candidatus Omnitrophota bacterium]